VSLRAYGFLLGDSGGGSTSTFDQDIDLVLTGPSNDLWMDTELVNYEVLVDYNGNVLIGPIAA